MTLTPFALVARWRAFRRNRRGVAAIEFGMLIPVFGAAMMAAMETSLDYYVRFELDRAAQNVMRQIQIRKPPADATALKTLFCAQLPATMDCARVVLDVRVVTDFTKVNWLVSRPTNPTTYAPGQPGDTVLLQSVYASPVIAPIWLTPTASFKVGDTRQNVRFISANAVARNES